MVVSRPMDPRLVITVIADQPGGTSLTWDIDPESPLVTKHGSAGQALAACREVIVADLDFLIETLTVGGGDLRLSESQQPGSVGSRHRVINWLAAFVATAITAVTSLVVEGRPGVVGFVSGAAVVAWFTVRASRHRG